MIKRILVGLGDRTYASVATTHAVELAQLHGAELTAVTIVDVSRLSTTGPVPIGGGAAARELREHLRNATQEVIDDAVGGFERACNEAGLTHNVLREEGDPFDCMISCARYYDLVVVGLRNLFEHGVVEEPPNELVRLVEEGVRPILAVADKPKRIRRVLVAYSGSMESAKTMKRFIELKLWPDLEIRIITFGDDEQAARQLLSEAAGYCHAHGYQAQTEFVPGSSKALLLSKADEWNADLVVIGNSAKRLLRRRLFGETALSVIRESQRPLFLDQ